MAVVIESTTQQSTYTSVTDVGSSGTFLVTKPTGLALNEVLFVATSITSGSITPPAGWSTGTVPNDFGSFTDYFYKTANAGDVAASNFTFATSSDSADYMYACLRLSGAANTRDPVISSAIVDTDDTPTSVSETLSPSVTTPNNSLALIFIGVDSQTTTGGTANLSGYALTGASLTFTQLFQDDDVGGSEDGAVFVYAPIASSSTITGISFTASGSKTPPTLFNVNVLYIYPQQDANASLSLTQTTNTALPAAESAGANASPVFTETTNESFTPTGKGTSPTRWVNEPKPDTDWINEQR